MCNLRQSTAGSHEDQVKELLAQLKDSHAIAPTPQPDCAGAEEGEGSEVTSGDEQVQSLVERAALAVSYTHLTLPTKA